MGSLLVFPRRHGGHIRFPVQRSYGNQRYFDEKTTQLLSLGWGTKVAASDASPRG